MKNLSNVKLVEKLLLIYLNYKDIVENILDKDN